MLLGGDSLVHTPRLRAFETNERRMAKFSELMDPCFVGRNATMLQYTQLAYADESTRRRMNNVATPKFGRFEEEWAKLNLAPMVMRGKADLQKAALIKMSVKKELAISGKLLTRSALPPFGREEVKIKHGENEDKSAGKLLVPSFPDEKMSEERGPSGQEEIESEMTRMEKTVNQKRRWNRILTKREKTTTFNPRNRLGLAG